MDARFFDILDYDIRHGISAQLRPRACWPRTRWHLEYSSPRRGRGQEGQEAEAEEEQAEGKRETSPTAPPPESCTPNCVGKVCGDDGCGGSCGACNSAQTCAQGQCVTGLGTCQTGQGCLRQF